MIVDVAIRAVDDVRFADEARGEPERDVAEHLQDVLDEGELLGVLPPEFALQGHALGQDDAVSAVDEGHVLEHVGDRARGAEDPVRVVVDLAQGEGGPLDGECDGVQGEAPHDRVRVVVGDGVESFGVLGRRGEGQEEWNARRERFGQGGSPWEVGGGSAPPCAVVVRADRSSCRVVRHSRGT